MRVGWGWGRLDVFLGGAGQPREAPRMGRLPAAEGRQHESNMNLSFL